MAEEFGNLINTNALASMIEKLVEQKVNQSVAQMKAELELIKRSQESKNILTLEESADYTGKKPSTIRTLIRKRLIPSYREGKRLYIKKEDLDDFLLKNRTSSNDEIAAKARKKMLELNRRNAQRISNTFG